MLGGGAALYGTWPQLKEQYYAMANPGQARPDSQGMAEHRMPMFVVVVRYHLRRRAALA